MDHDIAMAVSATLSGAAGATMCLGLFSLLGRTRGEVVWGLFGIAAGLFLAVCGWVVR